VYLKFLELHFINFSKNSKKVLFLVCGEYIWTKLIPITKYEKQNTCQSEEPIGDIFNEILGEK
jgi:hypothetical protein